jgi:hypothetical protein
MRAGFWFAALLLLCLPARAENSPCEKLATADMAFQNSVPLPLIKAMVEGKETTFLLSTTNEQSLISQGLQDAAGLANRPVPKNYLQSGGAFLDHFVSTKNLSIGGAVFDNSFLVLPDPPAGRTLTNVLGLEFMFHYKVDFDFAAAKVTLFAPDHCTAQAGWAEGPATELPFKVDATARPIIFPTLDGQRMLAFLDMWGAPSVMSMEAAKELFNIDVNTPGLEKVDEVTWRHTFKSLSLNGVVLHNVSLLLQAEGLSGHFHGGSAIKTVKMMIGTDLLQRLHVQLAYHQNIFYIALVKH